MVPGGIFPEVLLAGAALERGQLPSGRSEVVVEGALKAQGPCGGLVAEWGTYGVPGPVGTGAGSQGVWGLAPWWKAQRRRPQWRRGSRQEGGGGPGAVGPQGAGMGAAEGSGVGLGPWGLGCRLVVEHPIDSGSRRYQAELGDPGVEGRGAGWAPWVGRSGSGAGMEGASGVLRVGGKGAWQGVGRACGDCLPGGPGEVVMGRRRGPGL